MMRRINPSDWQTYCDRVSTGLAGKRAEIEVNSLGLGHQVQAQWLPLIGIAYDPNDKVIGVFLDGLDHMIAKPSEFYAEEGPTGLEGLAVVDGEGTRHIIQLKEPLMLPARQ